MKRPFSRLPCMPPLHSLSHSLFNSLQHVIKSAGKAEIAHKIRGVNAPEKECNRTGLTGGVGFPKLWPTPETPRNANDLLVYSGGQKDCPGFGIRTKNSCTVCPRGSLKKHGPSASDGSILAHPLNPGHACKADSGQGSEP